MKKSGNTKSEKKLVYGAMYHIATSSRMDSHPLSLLDVGRT